MSKIEQLKFAKVNYTKKRNQRRAERLALKSNKSENTLQKQVEKLLDTLGVRWLHIPNDVYRIMFSEKYRVPKHIGYKVSGYIKGVPDIIVFLKDGRFFCIELKVGRNATTREQKNFRNDVGFDNFYVCYNMCEVDAVLQKYNLIK